jgi:hypothetical protein
MQLERKKEAQARKDQEARREASTQAREAAAAGPKVEEGIVTPPDEITLPDMRPVGGR